MKVPLQRRARPRSRHVVCGYLTFSIEDSIEKDHVTIGVASPATEETVAFKVLLTFEGDLAGDANLVEAEVEAPESTVCVDFGDGGPDWDPEDDA